MMKIICHQKLKMRQEINKLLASQIGYVALVSGAPFGNPECVRISYAASDKKLLEAVKRMNNQLDKLYQDESYKIFS